MRYNYHTNLPIFQKKAEILDAVINNQVVIIAGETGSGKTTQLPLICLEAGRGDKGKIVCTQPRRIAAVSLANFTASCCESAVGEEIGFQVRFKTIVSEKTKIIFVTDGILLGEILNDPLLKQFDTIIIDEAHERSINIDFLIGHLRSILKFRPDLKVIISSATIDTRLFSRAFNNAPVITVSGRLFPVDIQYRPAIELWKGESMDSYIEGAIVAVMEIVNNNDPGDILIFFPTVQDICELIRRLEHILGGKAQLLPLHSRLHVSQQQLIFRKSRLRKIVVATNIAETSITVPGIRFVIDSGLVRMHRYESHAQLSRMPIERTSKASADQRAGRCGRVEAGVCIRLYSELDYMSRKAFTTPEIQRANLADVILRMSFNGLGDPAKFLFLQRPSYQVLKSAFQQLLELGAINKKGLITPLGKEMARLPLDPPVARILIYAKEQNAVRELMVIAAGLSVDDPFVALTDRKSKRNSRFCDTESDFIRLLNVWKAFRKVLWRKQNSTDAISCFCKDNDLSSVKMNEWFAAYQQIRRICRTNKGFIRRRSQPASYDAIHKSLLSGFFSGLASHSEADVYNGIHVDGIRIFPSSVIFSKRPKWVLFHEIIETSRIYGHTAAAIRPEWVETMFRPKCNYVCEETWYDPPRGVVRAREEVTFKGMLLLKNRHIDLERKDPGRAHEVFVKEGLVNELVGDRYRFIRHNRLIRNRIKLLEHKLRRNLYLGDWALEEFYAERLAGIKNIRELNEKIKQCRNDSFLMVPVDELLTVTEPLNEDDYPDIIHVGSGVCTVSYLFSPGETNDGAVITVNEDLFKSVPTFYWEWVLPVLWKQRIEIIVNVARDQLAEISVDTGTAVDNLLSRMSLANGKFVNVICSNLYKCYGIVLYPSDVCKSMQHPYVWPVVKVVDRNGFVVRLNRTFFSEIDNFSNTSGLRNSFWTDDCISFEQDLFDNWNLPLLKHVEIKSEKQNVPLSGIPALCFENGRVAARVFFSYDSASSSHADALQKLIENELAERLCWELEEISLPAILISKCKSIWPKSDILEIVKNLVVAYLLQLPDILPCDEVTFKKTVSDSSMAISKAIADVVNALERIVDVYESCQLLLNKKNLKYGKTYLGSLYEELCDSLKSYCSAFISCSTSINYRLYIPAILKEFAVRIEYAYDDPVKYRTKMKIKSFFVLNIERVMEKSGRSYQIERKKDAILIMIEDFIIAQFSTQSVKKSSQVQQADIQEEIEELRHVLEIPQF